MPTDVSYFNLGFLRQVTAEQDRIYLGLQPTTPPLPPPATLDWPQSVSKTTDQEVVSTDTLRADDELFLPVLANSFYLCELLLMYSGNSSTGDYKGRIMFPSLVGGGSAIGYVNGLSTILAPELSAVQHGVDTNFPGSDVVLGVTGTITDYALAQIRFLIRTVLPGTMRYLFANANGADGRTVITRAGSILRAQQLA